MWEKRERRRAGADTRREQPESTGIVSCFYTEGEGINWDVEAALNISR